MGATGTATIDFGAAPGSSDASIAVTGQASIVSGSYVEAWLRPEATADHSEDEHVFETIRVVAGNIVAGTGFTIYAVNTNTINEPVTPERGARFGGTGQDAGAGPQGRQGRDKGGNGTRIYGTWTIAWVWN
jgi:hypothetical protein